MRKMLILLTLCLIAAITAMAQGRVQTRSYILSDFQDKVTKVVIPEDVFLQSALRQEVVNLWSASAFEFCTQEEFEALKGSQDYYFLTIQAFKFKGEKEPGLLFLSLLKGENHNVISLPLAPADDSSGRELVYLGAHVKAIQDYTLAAMESEKTAYAPDKWFNANYTKWGHMMSIYMAREDVSLSVKDQDLLKFMDMDFILCDASKADEVFVEAPVNTLVSYSIAPVDPSAASYSYQLLFKADTLELFYISRHRIRPRSMAGFLISDIKWLAERR
ncbi:MAG: hypothetical protein IKO31_04455 [Bacteroidales bacterium]|nr:hypothetical protein [Bacteroidales bacterium]